MMRASEKQDVTHIRIVIFYLFIVHIHHRENIIQSEQGEYLWQKKRGSEK